MWLVFILNDLSCWERSGLVVFCFVCSFRAKIGDFLMRSRSRRIYLFLF